MKKNIPVTFIFILLFIPSSLFAFQIIVHPDNPITEISKKELKNIFLLKKKSWKGGKLIHPVQLNKNHPLRKKFSMVICGKLSSSLEKYYLKRTLSGKGQPPVTFNSEQEVIDYITLNRNTIGYVLDPNARGGNTKTIQIK